MMYGRRRLIRPCALTWQALYDECSADISAMHFRHQCAQADLRRELDAVRGELEALKAAVRARQTAQAELDGLYRERELMRALSAERDPALPLN